MTRKYKRYECTQINYFLLKVIICIFFLYGEMISNPTKIEMTTCSVQSCINKTPNVCCYRCANCTLIKCKVHFMLVLLLASCYKNIFF